MTDATLTLRPATEHDLPRIAAMAIGLYTEHPGPVPMTAEKVSRTFRQFRAHPETGAVYVIEEPGAAQTVGYTVVATFWSNEYGGPALVVDELYVDPAFRGLGIGRAALTALETRARAEGRPALLLEVEHDNPRARKLYESLGFRLTGRDHLRRLL